MSYFESARLIRFGKLSLGSLPSLGGLGLGTARRNRVQVPPRVPAPAAALPAHLDIDSGIAPHPHGGVYLACGQALYRIAQDGKASLLAQHDGEPLSGGAVDGMGNFYTTSAGGVLKFAPDGQRLALSVIELGSLSARLSVALDARARMYLADRTHQILWRIEAGGAVSRVCGAGTAHSFTQLGAIAADPCGGVLAIDRHAILRVSAAGVVTTLAGSVDQSGCTDGAAGAARFAMPKGLTADGAGNVAGNVYVSDTGNRLLRRIAPDGAVTTLASCHLPRAIALDARGSLRVCDRDRLFELAIRTDASGRSTHQP